MANKIYKNNKILYVCFEEMALMKWLANTVKMCLLLTILRLESFVETGVRDLENELFFQDHSRNNFVVIFESERFCLNLKYGSIDFSKTLNTRA